jgi:hypothetical protein
MSSRIKICRDFEGTWSVYGASPQQVSGLHSLSASIDYARKACNAAPATIELYIDGMYIVAHQERGWPKALVSSSTEEVQPVEKSHAPGGAPPWSRLMARFRGLRHLAAEPGHRYAGEREGSNVVSLKLV